MDNWQFYDTYAESMAGWYQHRKINPLLRAIDKYQRRRADAVCTSAGVVEIGVYHGKSFIPLALLCDPHETAIAIDPFRPVTREDLSAWGDRDVFDRHLARFEKAILAHLRVLVQDSQDLAPAALLFPDLDITHHDSPAGGERLSPCRFRLVSIDGLHTCPATLSDLRLAAAVLHDAGVILVDDYPNERWPGVRAAVDRFLLEAPAAGPDGWAAFYLAANKIALCRAHHHDAYARLAAKDPDNRARKWAWRCRLQGVWSPAGFVAPAPGSRAG